MNSERKGGTFAVHLLTFRPLLTFVDLRWTSWGLETSCSSSSRWLGLARYVL